MRSIILAVACIATSATGLAQTTWYVDVNNTPPGSGTQNDPYASIQYAIDQASTLAGDTLIVLPGVYHENIDLKGKTLALHSQSGVDATVLDGGGAAPVLRIESGEGLGTTIDGFTIQDGYAIDNGHGDLYGGGVRVIGSEAFVTNCRIHDSFADYGGAFYAESAVLTLVGCVIGANQCGGGVLVRSSILELADTQIIDQQDNDCSCCGYSTTALRATDSHVAIDSCVVAHNKAALQISGIELIRCDSSIANTTFFRNGNFPIGWIDQNGAMGVVDGQLVLRACVFEDNSSQRTAAAIDIESAYVELEDCTFDLNESSEPYWGGAVLVDASSSGSATLTARGCTFSRGFSAGGSAIWAGNATVALQDCLFRNNWSNTQYYGELGAGGALWFEPEASARIERCSFIENESNGADEAGQGGAIYARPGSTVTVRRSVFIKNKSSGDTWSGSHPPQGGACHGPMLIENSSFNGNSCIDDAGDPGEGGTIYGATLANCIVSDSFPDALAGGATADWSDIQGGWPGTGNFDADPMFWGPEHGDLHLLPGSPCIDAGDPNLTDQDGTRLDVGAYPFGAGYCGGAGTYCVAKINSAGCTPAIGWTGTPSIAGPDDFHVVATHVIPNRFGILAWSTAGASDVPFLGGILCLAPPQHRSPVLRSSTGTGCDGTFDYHFTQAIMQANGIGAGTRLYFQYWYRDPAHQDGTGAGLTDGLEAGVCLGG